MPPAFASILSTTVLTDAGPPHFGMSCGSVNALNTSLRGASNVRRMMTYCLPGGTTRSSFVIARSFLPHSCGELVERFVPALDRRIAQLSRYACVGDCHT